MDRNCSQYFDAFTQTPDGDLKTEYYNPFIVRHRKKTTKTQLQILENTFASNVRPDARMRRMLAEQLNMTPRSIQVWFQNRRAKEKKLVERKIRADNYQSYDSEKRTCPMKEFYFSPTNNSLYTPPWLTEDVRIMVSNESYDELSFKSGSQDELSDEMPYKKMSRAAL
ncbi:homeodomain-containing transcription factor [Tubulinosema ratisbonensis]|uniref:Homeodomain-containing transcription factor n=1 Tax=Tubulinosema ratisbonensis TaxID=291195 RepID=A0A437ANP6_9MICR|nr:homeodomain-containing transcription factor [Tubulinosema ratisbonensis]